MKPMQKVRSIPVVLIGCVMLACLAGSRPAQALNYETSWFANSFPGTPNQLHVQNDMYALYVTGNGTCYTNSYYDEGEQEAGIYQNGQVTGNCVDLHLLGRDGGQAIAADSNYVYVAMVQKGSDDGGDAPGTNGNGQASYPAANQAWYCIRRYTLSGASAPFSSGYGATDDMLMVNSGTYISGHNFTGHTLTGVASDGTYLYVSDPNSNLVKKYSLATMSQIPVQTWSVNSPGPMVMGGWGGPFLWMVQNFGQTTAGLIAFSSTGSVVAGINFKSGVAPTGLAYNGSNNDILVSDAGPDEDIKIYSLSNLAGSPTPIASVLGTVGGIFAGSGATIGTAGPLRFNYPTGVGVDSSGNIYVAQDGTCNMYNQGGGTVLESYTSSGRRNWWLYGLAYIDCADIDPASETDVYTKDKHYTMNWSSTTPGSEATYYAYTLNRFKYPEDPRLHEGTGLEAGAWVREFLGHKFLITNDQWSNNLIISRFNPSTDGQCAIPSTMFAKFYTTPDSTGWPENQPSTGEWIWRDSNGNGSMDAGEYNQPSNPTNTPSMWGWWIDSNGDVWEALQGTSGIRHFVCQGLDSHGNPIYNYAHMTTIPMPTDFNDLERIEYYPATDTMYLAGYSALQPNTNGDWKIIGKVVCRYDHWSSGPTLHRGYPLVPTFSDATETWPVSMSATGPYLFLTYALQNQVLVYNSDTGVQVGTITPGASVGGGGSDRALGWTDMPYGVKAYQRANGEYDIFNEDDWFAKVVMYRWTPMLQIQNLYSGDYINMQNGLQCTPIQGGWLSADWLQIPAASGMIALQNAYTGGYLNVASGSLQCNSTYNNTALWELGDDGGYNIFTNYSSGGTINTQNGFECSPGDGSWWSEMWTLYEVN